MNKFVNNFYFVFVFCVQKIYLFLIYIWYLDLSKTCQTYLGSWELSSYDEQHWNHLQEQQLIVTTILRTMKIVAKVLAFLYISCGILFLMTPLATYYFEGELGLIFEIYIPGLDYKTRQGYIITSFLHFL
jgi:hypothetical protein